MQCQRVAAGIILAAGLGLAQVEPAPPEGAFRISADVDRVVLPVTVVDHRDRVVPNLTKDCFRIYDEGRPQAVHDFFYRDIPLTVGLVMDSSTSMMPKRGTAILAALNFVRLSNPEDQAFVVNFNEKVSFGLPEAFSADPSRLGEAFLKLPCQGKTALYDAVLAATERLSGGTRDKKALIVVSDGGDNASRHRLQETVEALRHSEAIVYTIGLFDSDDPDRNPAVLKHLARPSGGEAFFPETPADLPAILAHVAKVLRSQYTITYAPAAEDHDGRYHRIRVIASAPDGRRLAVRTRAGYYAPAPTRATTGASQ
jgi:VWFA-related protein